MRQHGLAALIGAGLDLQSDSGIMMASFQDTQLMSLEMSTLPVTQDRWSDGLKADSPVCPGSDLSISHVELVVVITAQHARALKATANLKSLHNTSET